MTAGEDQLEPLVGEAGLLHLILGDLGTLEQLRLLGERALAADAIDRAVARGRHEPRAGVAGCALARPALGGDREGLLRGFLGEIEVAEEANQAGEDTAPLVPEDALDQRSTRGRTSIAPPSRAAGIRAASSIAASRSAASNR